MVGFIEPIPPGVRSPLALESKPKPGMPLIPLDDDDDDDDDDDGDRWENRRDCAWMDGCTKND
jgi:hypothetical protein